MKKHARQLLVYSLAGILLSGLGATAVQAAPYNRADRQQQEETRQQRSKQPSTSVQRQEHPRTNIQRQEPTRTNIQRQEPTRTNIQRQEPMRTNIQRQEPMRTNIQRQEPTRTNIQREEPRRLDLHRPEQQRLSVRGQTDRSWQDRNNRVTNNYSVRQHSYNHDRYHGSNWRASGQAFHHRQPWEWRTRNHIGRHFISDSRWAWHFPGLRSYRWYGAGFWYQGLEYRDLVLFYDDNDELVAIGFWNHGRFIMIRDDNRSYYNDDSFVLGYRNHNLQLRINL